MRNAVPIHFYLLRWLVRSGLIVETVDIWKSDSDLVPAKELTWFRSATTRLTNRGKATKMISEWEITMAVATQNNTECQITCNI